MTITGIIAKRELFSAPTQITDGRLVENELEVIASAPHRVGPSDAEVTFVEFFDLQCPACRMLHLSMDSVLTIERLSVRIVRHHYPLTSIHPRAQDLALAGLCSESPEAFEHYYRQAFVNQGLLGSEGTLGPLQLMPEGTDTAAVRECMRQPATWEKLAQEVRLGESLKLRATPSFIVHGRLYTGTRSAAELSALIKGGIQ